MQENLLMSLESNKNVKKWRNISIVMLLLVFLIMFSKTNNKSKEISGDKIAEIKLEGVIDVNDYRDDKIREIINNDKIKAVILEIDSPGGMVTPSEVLYNLVLALNQKKPVVVIMDSMAASGGYMVSLGADYIIAKNTTLTGSIGVLLQSYNFARLADKIGVELKAYKSSDLKGMPSYFELNNKESNLAMQSMINDVFDYFTGLVKQRRKLTDKNFKLATNGQAFTGRQALAIGLVDEIGDKNNALNYLKTKGINKDLPIQKIELYEESNKSLFQKIVGEFYSNFEAKNSNSGLMMIYGSN